MLSLHKMLDIWLITALLTLSNKDGALLESRQNYMIFLLGGCVGCVFNLIAMQVGLYSYFILF